MFLAWNGKMIKDELEKIWEETIMGQSRYCPGINPGGTE
jgi:hypothetical protein